MLLNAKKPEQVYSDKFRISNMNINRIDLANEDDKARGLTEWARLFKAKSWEELKMLVKENDVLDQAVSSVSQLTEDKRIRDEIWKREDNERIELTNRHVYERTAAELADAKETIKRAGGRDKRTGSGDKGTGCGDK